MSSSRKSKEDTWTEEEVLKAIKPKDQTKRPSDGDRRDKRERGKDDRSRPRQGESSRSQKESHKSRDAVSEGRSKHKDGEAKTSIKERTSKEREKRRSRGDAEKTHKSKISDIDPDVSEHRSLERKEKRKSERTTKEHEAGGKEWGHERKDKERGSGEKKKKERRKRTGSGEVRYQLNETFDKEAFEKEMKRRHEKDAKKDDSDDKEKQRGERNNHKKDGGETKSVISSAAGTTKSEVVTADDEDDYNYDDDEFDDYDDDDFEDDDDGGVDGGDEIDDVEDNTGGNDKVSEHIINITHAPDDDLNQDNLTTFTKGKYRGNVELNISRDMDVHEKLSAVETLNMNDVVKAIFAENERASSNTSSRNNSRPSTSTERIEKESASPKPVKKIAGRINFVAASQKQMNEKAARKTKRRGEELLQLVQLDVRSIDLFDMPPMSEYELYMKRFGQSGCTQVYTQSNEENISQNTQTDEIETTSKWCQCSHEIKSCGTDEENNSSGYPNTALINLNTSRLNGFLLKAGQIVLSLFNELEAVIEQLQKQYTELRTMFSEGYVSLASVTSAFSFSNMSYSPSHTNMLLAAYGESRAKGVGIESSKGIITVWNTNDPTAPSAYLACESIPTCCCFSSSSPMLVFAGMEDGVLCVWDLREPASCHDSRTIDGETKKVLRTATFTTAALKENHEFPVITVSPLLSNSWRGNSQSNGEIDMSFQLISLDQSGKLNIWIVVEVHVDASDLTNVNDDFGLSPNGCIKLSRSSSMNVFASTSSLFESLFCATCIQVAVTHPNHLYIGTDKGSITHALRFGSRPIPKVFKTNNNIGNKVNAIDVSPWKLSYFLACFEDGSVSLFHTERETAICKWKSSSEEPIINVKWSKSKASIFFALDATSTFYVWDMFVDDMEPIFVRQMKRKDKRAIDFALANDYSFVGVGTPGRGAEMAVIYDDGSIEIHRLSKTISTMDADELDRLEEYLGDIM